MQHMHPRAALTALDRASTNLAHARVLAVREQAVEYPPTWKSTLARLDAFRAAGGQWLLLERDEVARLFALESFLVSAARSGDVEDRSGRALDEPTVTAWIQRALKLDHWAIARVVSGRAEPAAAIETPAPVAVEPRPAVETSVVETCMAQLRLVALERLVREVARVRKGSTRADVLAGLEAMKDRVEWFGNAIVALRPGPQ